MNAAPVFPIDDFLEMFDEFSSIDIKVVQSCGKRAMHYVKFGGLGMPIPTDEDFDRWYALFLMTAHILKLKLDAQNSDSQNPSGGGSSVSSSSDSSVGRIRKAVIGSVSVETDSPNGYTATDWSYWLNQTQYGTEFLAYMESVAPLGVYLNRLPDTVRVLT